MAAAAPRPVLIVEDVEKRYGVTPALRGVSLQVSSGETLGLLGPNGAGKTSLIRMLLDLTRPDSGRLLVLGEEPSTRTRDRIGYLPEERGLYPKQRVVDVLSYLVSLAGLEPGEARRRSERWLDRVGLGTWARRRVRELSKGMQQKVQLGAAVLHEPALLVLDEPFSGLDPLNRKLVGEVVGEMRARGSAIVISTHQMDEVEQICDRVVLLRGGSMLLQGEVTEVRRRFALSTLTVSADQGWESHASVLPLLQSTSVRGRMTTVALKEDARPEDLLRAMLGAGIGIEHFSRDLPSLNEVFVIAVAADEANGGAPSEAFDESSRPRPPLGEERP